MRKPAFALALVTTLSATGMATAAPAKKPAPKKPPVKKPAENSGGGTQITALEGDLVGKDHVNGPVRFRFSAPIVSLARKGDGVEEGKVWVIIPFEASNTTKDQLGLSFDQADLGDDVGNVSTSGNLPEPLDMLPGAHGKREVAFYMDRTFKPTKLIVQPNHGRPLRLFLPKGFAPTPPSTTGKVGELVSNGLVKFKIGPLTPAAKFGDDEAEEGQHYLVGEWQVVSEFPDRRSVMFDKCALENAEGEQVDATALPAPAQLATGGSKAGKVAFYVSQEFKPVKVIVLVSGSEAPITINLK